MDERINEELRQYKLFRIQETESKLRRFNNIHSEIEEHFFVNFSKNTSSNVLRIIIKFVSIVLFIISLICLFPNQLIEFLKPEGETISNGDSESFRSLLNISMYFFISLSILFFSLNYLLKINNNKRNSIYHLSKLLEEIMEYLEVSSNEEKRKYEYFIDSLAEKEQLKRKQ